MDDRTIKSIYSHTLRNRQEVLASVNCGCIACLCLFPASDVVAWADKGETAICPFCGIDAVLGDATGWGITPELLAELNEVYF